MAVLGKRTLKDAEGNRFLCTFREERGGRLVSAKCKTVFDTTWPTQQVRRKGEIVSVRVNPNRKMKNAIGPIGPWTAQGITRAAWNKKRKATARALKKYAKQDKKAAAQRRKLAKAGAGPRRYAKKRKKSKK